MAEKCIVLPSGEALKTHKKKRVYLLHLSHRDCWTKKRPVNIYWVHRVLQTANGIPALLSRSRPLMSLHSSVQPVGLQLGESPVSKVWTISVWKMETSVAATQITTHGNSQLSITSSSTWPSYLVVQSPHSTVWASSTSMTMARTWLLQCLFLRQRAVVLCRLLGGFVMWCCNWQPLDRSQFPLFKWILKLQKPLKSHHRKNCVAEQCTVRGANSISSSLKRQLRGRSEFNGFFFPPH